MSPSPRRTSPALLVFIPVLALGCAAVTGPDDTADALLTFTTSVAVAPSHVGTIDPRYELELRSFYERSGGERVAIDTQRIALSAATLQTQPVSMSLDVVPCLVDVQRTPAGPGCPVRITLLLWLRTNGVKLDYQQLGPFALVPGAILTLSEVIPVEEIVFLDVIPREPAIVVGGTVPLVSRFFTVTGDTVTRPVQWRTEHPGIAAVSPAGIVTGLAPGRANILAHWGEGQSSNGQVVTVMAPSTSTALAHREVRGVGFP